VIALGSTAATGSIAASTTESTIASATSGGSISTATAATETATSATLGSLNEALVNLKNLLLLTLTFALGLATGSSDEVLFLILVNWLGVSPLLILLATLVWLAGLRDTSAKLKLLLGKCGKVISVGDAIILWFGLGLSISWRNLSFLLFGLGNSLTSLLILQFSIAFVRAPAMGDLLLRVTVVVRKKSHNKRIRQVSPDNSTAVSVKGTATSATFMCSTGATALFRVICSPAAVGGTPSVAITES
jgi:hypothetical protein